jgi:hypothetical protein
MTAAQAIILVGGSLLLITAMIKLMVRANQRERRYMQRRYEEWVAGGSIPEDKPNFYSGSEGGSSS